MQLLLVLAVLLAACCPAQAQIGTPQTPAALNTEINSLLASNTTQAITAADLRQVTLDIVASMLNSVSFGANPLPTTLPNLPSAPGATWATIVGTPGSTDHACFVVAGDAFAIQDCGGIPNGTVLGNVAGGSAPPAAILPSQLGLVTGPSSATPNDGACFGDATGKKLVDCSAPPIITRTAVLTGATTVASTNCAQTLYLQGGTQWTLTFPAATSVPNECVVDVVNSEINYPVGKTIAGVPLPSATSNNYILYPTQRFRIQAVGGVWNYVQQPTRWVNPNGATIAFYTNYSTGSDVAGVNDGLSPNRPFQTANNALYTALATLDCNGGTQEVQAVVAMASNRLDNAGIHWSPHGGPLGCAGGASVQVVGASLAVAGAVNNGSGQCRLTVATSATFIGTVSGTTLTVQSMYIGDKAFGASAQIAVGAMVNGTGVTGGTVITGQLTGAGGPGTYTVNNSQSVTLENLTATLAGGGSNLPTGSFIMVYGIQGATACNGMWKVTAVDATHIDLQGSAFSGTYTTGGTITESSGFGGGSMVQTYFGSVIELWNLMFISGSSGPCISAQWGSKIYFQSGNLFGGCTGSDFQVVGNSLVQVEDIYGIFGVIAGADHIVVDHGGIYQNLAGISIMPTAGLAYTTFALAVDGGMITFVPAGSITLGAGSAVSGKRCDAEVLGLVDSGTGTPNTFFPGTVNCTAILGGQIN